MVAVVQELTESVVEGADMFGDVGAEVEGFPSEGSVEGLDVSVELGRTRRRRVQEHAELDAGVLKGAAEFGAAIGPDSARGGGGASRQIFQRRRLAAKVEALAAASGQILAGNDLNGVDHGQTGSADEGDEQGVDLNEVARRSGADEFDFAAGRQGRQNTTDDGGRNGMAETFQFLRDLVFSPGEQTADLDDVRTCAESDPS